jgi:hypothetical protein
MFNLDSRTKSKLVWVATLLAPVLAVQAVRATFGVSTTPTTASAAPIGPQPSAPATPAADPEKALTPTQAKARGWLLSRTHTLQTRSPMDRPDPAPIAEVAPKPADASPTPAPVIPIDDMPVALSLSAMIGSNGSGQPLTLINHKVYRVGEAVTPHWRVASIDTKKRIVTLVGPDNRTIELRQPSPSVER